MTCIAAIVEENIVYMGGDSLASNSYSQTVLLTKKIFRKHDMLIGVSGSLRSMQLVQYELKLPERNEIVSADEYIIIHVVGAIKDLLKTNGDLYKTNERDSSPTLFLIGYRGAIYTVHSDFGVTVAADGYDAIGSGEEHAVGALYATRFEANPRKRIHIALEAAMHHAVGVRDPFYIEELHEEKTETLRREDFSMAGDS